MSNCALTNRTTIAIKWLFGPWFDGTICVQENSSHGPTYSTTQRHANACTHKQKVEHSICSLLCALFIALWLNNCQGNYSNWFFAFIFKQNELAAFALSLAPKIAEPQLFILFANYSCTVRHHHHHVVVLCCSMCDGCGCCRFCCC